MNIVFQWVLALIIIALISAVVMGLVMVLYWIYHTKKVIKNIPKDIEEKIRIEKQLQREVDNGRENTTREGRRRTANEEITGLSSESTTVQPRSSFKIPEIREIDREGRTESRGFDRRNRESEERNQSDTRSFRKLPRI